jgi:hypothetical protein
MPRTKQTKEEKVVKKSKHSDAYLSFKSFLQLYAEQNPAKYEAKKEALLEKLNQL